MITIIPECGGYKVEFRESSSRGFSERVKTLVQVYVLIDHYYQQPHDESKCLFCLRVKNPEKVEKEFRGSSTKMN